MITIVTVIVPTPAVPAPEPVDPIKEGPEIDPAPLEDVLPQVGDLDIDGGPPVGPLENPIGLINPVNPENPINPVDPVPPEVDLVELPVELVELSEELVEVPIQLVGMNEIQFNTWRTEERTRDENRTHAVCWRPSRSLCMKVYWILAVGRFIGLMFKTSNY